MHFELFFRGVGPLVPAQKGGKQQKPDTFAGVPPDGLLRRRGQLSAPVKVASALVTCW